MIRKTISCMAIAVAAILTSVYTLTGCQSHQGDENQLENDIDSFATYYFNWQFPKTLKYCTQSSESWLRYAASNVHQADEQSSVGIRRLMLALQGVRTTMVYYIYIVVDKK